MKNFIASKLLVRLCLVFIFQTFLLGELFAASVPKSTAVSNEAAPKICLTMIVKNESRIIERCLNSVKNIVDCISISDTGSSDNTVAIIEKFMDEHNIPGKVHQHTWQNFGHNRTLSAKAAQQTLSELGFSLPNTYLLLLDADMLLDISPEFTKKDLRDDYYLLTQTNIFISYYNTRLIRASLPWSCVGVTHEYWNCPFANGPTKLKTLSIDDREDGGCKADKFERDIALLTAGLKDEPNNHRYMFYLAQSYKSIGRCEEAIPWYLKRIQQGGWKEEVWYSKYMLGECYEALDLWEKALNYYLDAYEYNPERSETLQKVASHYGSNSSPHLAYMFAKHGKRIAYPNDQLLFVSYPTYDYQFDEILSIASYYTPYRSDGLEAINRLILSRTAPSYIIQRAYLNALFYVNNLADITYHPVGLDLPYVRPGLAARYQAKNASIQRTEDGYNLICGAVNYTQKGAVNFTLLDGQDTTHTVRSRNFLVTLDKNWQTTKQEEILEELQRPRHPSIVNVKGVEDPRFFHYDNAIWFTCTTLDTNPQPPHIHQQSLCKLGSSNKNSERNIEKLLPLIGPDLTRCEKNWLPFVKDDKIHILYSYDPFIIHLPDLNNGMCNKTIEYTPKHNFSQWRGSAAPIEFDGGYLALVHEMVFQNERFYMHRFIWMDRDFVIQKASLPFIFKHKGIEFCAGMTTDHDENNLVLAIGFEDRETNVGVIPLASVRELLQPLP